MNNLLKKITAGVLGAGLLLGCCGCGLQEVVPTDPPPTVHKDTPAPVEVIEGPVSPHLLKLANLKIAPKYPQMPQHPREEDYPTDSLDYYNAQEDWAHKRRQCIPDSPEDAHILHPFIETAMEQFLTGEDNSVCSPINIYFALAMLAETSTGTSRQQILDALGHSSIESLRAQANQLWLAHYCSDGQTDSLFANSVWLDEQYSFQQKTLSTLGQDHYASVFTGDLGAEEMNKQLAAYQATINALAQTALLDTPEGKLAAMQKQQTELDMQNYRIGVEQNLVKQGKALQDYRELFSEKTVIITAHRFSSVVDCDEILYLRDGEIVERGTFQELMELNGSFARVYNVQQAQQADALTCKTPTKIGGDNNG